MVPDSFVVNGFSEVMLHDIFDAGLLCFADSVQWKERSGGQVSITVSRGVFGTVRLFPMTLFRHMLNFC